ncbi:zinc finger MYM-type protein 1-like [Pomacea canaliculata]|uniref:zinc finger MYM-type protein 1-like n=1 Tax=Pomacea canaliculata TaxID=400727 RepID=UPI000D73AFC9|nr:zinc finger MYM-type protein 1-like [Pomacea canaliculata]
MCENQQENFDATHDGCDDSDNKRGGYDTCHISASTEALDEIHEKPADGLRSETETGFNNWKKALEKFNCHHMSSAHRAVVGNKMARESGISVYGQISTQYESQQKQNLASFMNELKSLVFLLRQALPIRGHDDDEGNLHQCLKICFSEHKWTEDGSYLSPEIVNELIQIMAHSILRCVLADIRQANCAEVRGQAYDGASTFQGHISGVAKRFRDEVPSAISVHCLAHSVNLVLQETARKTKIIRDALDFAQEIIQLITLSPKRQVLFDTIQKEAGGSSPTIKPLCPTRWTVRTRAMESLIKNYEILQERLEVVSEGSDEYARRASGLLMQQFSTFVGRSLARTVFAVTEELSTALQKQSTSCEDASSAASVCIYTLQKMRSDEYFLDFFNDVKAKASRLCDAPRLPRQRQVPRQFDEGSEGHWYTDIAAYDRQQYFETLDHIVENIQRRFHQDSLNVPRQIEKLLCEAALGKSTEIPRNIVSTYIYIALTLTLPH